MRIGSARTLLVAALGSALSMLGCSSQGDFKTAEQIAKEKAASKATNSDGHDHDHDSAHDHDHDHDHDAAHDHAHDHDEAGPHGGSLVEFGEHEYHGEIVVEDAQQEIRIYLLDKTLKQPVSSPSQAIVLKTADQELTFKSLPQVDDPAGTSSVYVLADAPVVEALLKQTELRGTFEVILGEKKFQEEIALTFYDEDQPAPEEPAKPPTVPAAVE